MYRTPALKVLTSKPKLQMTD